VNTPTYSACRCFSLCRIGIWRHLACPRASGALRTLGQAKGLSYKDVAPGICIFRIGVLGKLVNAAWSLHFRCKPNNQTSTAVQRPATQTDSTEPPPSAPPPLDSQGCTILGRNTVLGKSGTHG